MIISTRRILSGLAGFALLAMPVGAAAGMSPVGFPPVPLVQQTPPVMPPTAWTDAQFGGDGAPTPRLWYVHHEPDGDDYPAMVCDEDGDDCRPVARYRCDRDGDNCNSYGQPYRDDPPQYQDYGRQYGVPSYCNGRPDLLSERQHLARQLDYAQAQFHAARAAGERKLSARWASHIKDLNHRLAALDAQAADAAYGFHQPPSRSPYADYPPAGYPPSGYPPTASPYAPGYGANPNGASPNGGTSGLGGRINSLLGPSAGSLPPGSSPAGSPYAPGYGANPNGASPNGGTSGLGGMMNSLLGSFTGNGTAP